MTLQKILKRFEDKNTSFKLRRRSWEGASICYYSGDYFYSAEGISSDCIYAFTAEELLADDWEYQESVWVVK